MLNEKNERELCYVVVIDAIEPIVGSDNCEAAVVGEWRVMTRKGTFKPGDLAIYFEIDSKVPQREPYMFLAKKHFKVKTQKYTFGGKGNFISQGLLMTPTDFGWSVVEKNYGKTIVADNNEFNPNNNSRWLTKELGVVYSVAEDNKRKSHITKYDKMYQRHLKLFKKYDILRRIYKYNIGKKILFLFLGKKRDEFTWPSWVQKTDEERCQNMPWLFPGNPEQDYIVTEKIDGSSTTFTLKGRKKREFYVCSRNVCFDKPEKMDKCYYDTNIYLEMSEKYEVEKCLNKIMDSCLGIDFVTIQGETYGEGVQKRTYGLTGREFATFNLVLGYENGRIDKITNASIIQDMFNLDDIKIPVVPVVETLYTLPETCKDLLEYAAGPSKIDGEMREGIVLRRKEDGIETSFKAVDNNFLLTYHNG